SQCCRPVRHRSGDRLFHGALALCRQPAAKNLCCPQHCAGRHAVHSARSRTAAGDGYLADAPCRIPLHRFLDHEQHRPLSACRRMLAAGRVESTAFARSVAAGSHHRNTTTCDLSAPVRALVCARLACIHRSNGDFLSDGGQTAMTTTEGVWFIYDGDCPICQYAALALRIKREYGALHLLNARTDPDHPLLQAVNARGLDLDAGMVIVHNGTFYHGKRALRFMARHGDNQGWFNRFNRLLFWSDRIAALLYPWMRATRNFLLRRRQRPQID